MSLILKTSKTRNRFRVHVYTDLCTHFPIYLRLFK